MWGQPPRLSGRAEAGCGVSGLHRDPDGALEPPGQVPQRQFTLHAVPFLAVSNLFLQRRKKIKRDIGRLEVLRIRTRDVVRERTEGGSPRGRGDLDRKSV